MNKNCQGCWEEDCDPQYNSYADLMLCDRCYEKAQEEECDARDMNDRYEMSQYYLDADGFPIDDNVYDERDE